MAVQKILLSPCHQAVIDGEKWNEGFIGRCRVCRKPVTRYNSASWKQEWLDDRSATTTEALREVREDEWAVL